jgi:hypothetical protein
MAIRVTAPAVCVADSVGTVATMCGATGAYYGPYDSPDVNRDSQDNYVLRRLAPAVRSGRNVLATLSRSASGIFAICCDLTWWSAWLGARFHRVGGPFVSNPGWRSARLNR